MVDLILPALTLRTQSLSLGELDVIYRSACLFEVKKAFTPSPNCWEAATRPSGVLNLEYSNFSSCGLSIMLEPTLDHRHCPWYDRFSERTLLNGKICRYDGPDSRLDPYDFPACSRQSLAV